MLNIFGPFTNAIIVGVLIAAIGGGLYYVGKKVYNIIEENGRSRIQIEMLEKSNKDLTETVDKLVEQRELDMRIVLSHQQDMEEMQRELENLNRDLGQGAEDPAAEALKEYFRRLKGLK